MFKDLLMFEKDRTPKEALGFYLGYLLLSLPLGALASFFFIKLYSPSSSAEEFQAGVEIGGRAAVIFCLVLSFMILHKKKKLQNFGYVLVGILSGICAIFAGGLLGLIPVAYLTTIKKL